MKIASKERALLAFSFRGRYASGQRVDSVLIPLVRKLGLVFALLVVQIFLEQFAARFYLLSCALSDPAVHSAAARPSQRSWQENFL